MNSSVGIDDFLLNYRHHQSSIQDFMSSLDEPMPIVSKRNVLVASTSSGESVSSSPEFEIESDTSSLEPAAPKAIIQTTQIANSRFGKVEACKTISKALQPRKTIGCKQALTEKEKDERRRIQNREAQRRYRERHMLEAYRKASSNLHGQLLGWLHIE